MNENLKRIIDATETGTGGRWVSVDILEYFAEQIVRECSNRIMSDTDRFRKEYFAAIIKEHFGIKE